MKKNYKGRITGLVLIAFIVGNAFLIYFDKEGRVDRKSYIEEWTQSFTYDLFEKIDTRGVFTAQESNPVYFNGDVGSFKEFLVEEGETVDEGDELYTYEIVDYQIQENQLESKINRLEEEVDALEEYIDELESYTVPEPERETESTDFFGNDSEDSSNPPPSYVETEYLKEKEIAKQEAALERKEAMLQMVEDQLDQLQETGEEITVTSPYAGTVTELSENLRAPLLTLKSTNLHIQGDFSEKERKKVEEGMATRLYVPNLELKLSGTLTSIHTFPEDVEVHRSSSYPFEVTPEEMDEQLLPGYHTDVQVITDEALEVVSAFESALTTDKNLYAWVMNEEGRLERRAVDTGITENGIVEIAEGLEAGEWLAAEPKDEFRRQAAFVTPIHLEDLYFENLLNLEKNQILTYGLLGLLAR